jgi:hypothetical protein
MNLATNKNCPCRTLISVNLETVRHAQVRHDVQGATTRSELSGLGGEQPCAQVITKDRFEAKDGSLG